MDDFTPTHFISLRDFLRFSLIHRGRILAGLLATVALVFAATLLTAPTYEASSLVLVKFGREYVYRAEVGDRGTITPGDRAREALVNTELQILRSQDLAQRVVSAVGVNRLYPRLSTDARPPDPRVMGAAVAAFSSSLLADRMPSSDVIRISFRHTDAEMSAQALNVLVDHFKEKHLQAFSEPAAAGFLQDKVNTYREALGRSEERLKALQLQGKSFSVDDQRTALFQQRRDIEAGLKDSRNQIAGLQEKLRYLKSEQQKLSTTSGRGSSEQNKAISDASAQLLELQLQEQKLLATFSDTSRSVQGVRQQIALVKDFLEQQRAAIGRGEFAQELEKQAVNVVAELRYQEARRDNLLEQLGPLEKQLGELTSQEGAYRELVHEREANEQNYRVYLQKLEEARISEEMDREKIANISVIQPAVVPLRPIWPSKTLNLLIGVLLGLTVGYAWAFVSGRLGSDKSWAQVAATAHRA